MQESSERDVPFTVVVLRLTGEELACYEMNAASHYDAIMEARDRFHTEQPNTDLTSLLAKAVPLP